MRKSRKTLTQQIEQAIQDYAPQIRDAFLTAIQGIMDNAILQDIVDAIGRGDPIGAFNAMGFSDAAMRPLTKMIETAFEAGGIIVASSFPRILNTPVGRTVFQFDVRNSRAEAWLRDHSGSLITRIRQDTLEAARNVMTDGMAAGRNPRSTALDLVGRINPLTGKREGGIVGLTPQQERWVAAARKDLEELNENYFNRKLRDRRFDSVVRKAIEAEEELDAATIDKLVSRYKDSVLQYRGETIARTEAIQSLNKAAVETFQQVIDAGALKSSDVKRVWQSSGDDGRTRETHLEMDGQEVGMDEPFVAPEGDRLMFPGDTALGADPSETINCRCRVQIKVDWMANVR